MGVRSRVIGILFAPRRNEFGSRTNTGKVEGRDVPEPGMAAITNILATTHRMQHVRLQLKWRLHTGVTVPREATFCGVLYVTLKGQ